VSPKGQGDTVENRDTAPGQDGPRRRSRAVSSAAETETRRGVPFVPLRNPASSPPGRPILPDSSELPTCCKGLLEQRRVNPESVGPTDLSKRRKGMEDFN